MKARIGITVVVGLFAGVSWLLSNYLKDKSPRTTQTDMPRIALSATGEEIRLGKDQVVLQTADVQANDWQFTTVDPGPKWAEATFDATSWMRGQSGFGVEMAEFKYGMKINTLWNSNDIWMRTKVNLPANFRRARVTWKYYHDDNLEVYVNGQLEFSEPGWMTEYQTLDREQTSLRAGENVIAVHCHNAELPCGVDVGLSWAEIIE